MIRLKKIKWNKQKDHIYTSKCGKFTVDNGFQDYVSATISEEILSLAKTDCSWRKEMKWSNTTAKYAKDHCQIIYDLIQEGKI